MNPENFRNLLKPLKEKSFVRQAPASLGDSEALKAVQLREKIEDSIRPYLEGLIEVIPALAVTHRLYDGAYVVGVRCVEPHGDWHGRPIRALNRLDFLIRVVPGTGKLRVSCRSTALNHDYATTRFTAPSDGHWDDLDQFVEQSCLTFADHYFVELGQN